jgi:hypothetical protein
MIWIRGNWRLTLATARARALSRPPVVTFDGIGIIAKYYRISSRKSSYAERGNIVCNGLVRKERVDGGIDHPTFALI